MQHPSVNISIIHRWLFQKTSIEAARAELVGKGMEEDIINLHVMALQKERVSSRQTNGFILMGIGAFLGFVSCVCAITGVLPNMQYFILYGLTFIGVSLACWGMYFVFEK